MRKSLIAGLLISGLMMPTLSVATMKHAKNPDKKVEQLRKSLNLTPEQEIQVRKIVVEEHDRMMEARRDANDDIQKLLTSDQREKFNKMMPEMGSGKW